MLSKLSKLATKRILRNVKCQKALLVRLGRRTYLTSRQDAERWAQNCSKALVSDFETSNFENGEIMKMLSPDVQWNVNNLTVKGRESMVQVCKGFRQYGQFVEAVPIIHQWYPQAVSFYFLVKNVDNNGNVTINTSLNFHYLDENGLITAQCAYDIGSLGLYDDALDGVIDQEASAAFDSREKTEEWYTNTIQAFVDDMSQNSGDFVKNYCAEGFMGFTPGFILDGAGTAKFLEDGSSVVTSVEASTTVNGFGPFNLYGSCGYSIKYKDGTHNVCSGQQIVFVDNDGKMTASYGMFNGDDLQNHVIKVQSLL